MSFVSPKLVVLLDPGDALRRAEHLAASLGLPCAPAAPAECTHVLRYDTHGRLTLGWSRRNAPAPVAVDFAQGATARRGRGAAGRGRAIARALGLGRGVQRVVDATAGLGRDAFVLALCGLEVCAVERVAAVWALLADAAERAAADPELGPRLGGRLAFLHGDARAYLAGLAEDQRPDAVYLDPMFAKRDKTALVKKEMQLFWEVVGGDEDAGELLAAARRAARRRVVVKRPRHAPPLAPADGAVHEQRVRFDLYLPCGG